MSAVRAAVRTLVVGTGRFGARVWADTAPERATLPYVTITDTVSLTPEVSGDGRTQQFTRQMQVDVWERLTDEDPTLHADVVTALDGIKVHPQATAAKVTAAQRLPEQDTNIAHLAVTLELRHPPSLL